MSKCPYCHSQVSPGAAECPSCRADLASLGGVYQQQPHDSDAGYSSPKSQLAVILLCFFLGGLGIHRFYVGRWGLGILLLITLGGLGVWVIIDFVLAVLGKIRDADGLPVNRS
ncbi:MAG: NINE protein [Deltaproteobacteria bacterium]|jgi:hypothetical protein|nr:NINE protein [Deltaproteobacteria bacterium]